MVNKAPKINKFLKISSKYMLDNETKLNTKLEKFLDELADTLKAEWACIKSKYIDQKFYSSRFKEEELENPDINIDKNYKLYNCGILEGRELYIYSAKDDFEDEFAGVGQFVEVVIISCERNSRYKHMLELTSDLSKSMRPDIALDKVFNKLQEYIDIRQFDFLLRNELNPKQYFLYFAASTSTKEVDLVEKDHFYDEKEFETIRKEHESEHILFQESRLINESLGYLILTKVSPWSEEQREMVEFFADQIAIILNQYKLHSEVLSIVQREFLLNQITNKIRDSLDTNEVLNIGSMEIAQIMGADSCGILLFEQNSLSKERKKAFWATSPKFDTHIKKIMHSLRYGVFAGRVEDNKETCYCISDFESQANIHPIISSFHRDYGAKSLITCALEDQFSDELLGIIVIASFDHSNEWGEKEKELMEAISKQIEMAVTHSSLYQDSQHTRRQMALLHQLSIDIRNSLELSTVLGSIARGIGEVMGVSRCFVRRFSSNQRILKTEQEYTAEAVAPSADIIFGFEKRWINSLFSKDGKLEAHSKDNLNIKSIYREFNSADDAALIKITEAIELKSYLSVPLIAQGRLLGTINVHQCNKERTFTDEDIKFISQVGSEATVAIKNAEMFDTIDKMSKIDADTGLYNKRYFNTIAEKEIQKAADNDLDISLMMVDLDHLKSLNDTYGHEAGDEAIMLMADVLSNTVRQTSINEIHTRVADLVGRFGGDEFIVLLPNTDVENAELAAMRIANNLRKAKHSSWEKPLTCSIGIAGTPIDSKTLHNLKIRADQALYMSKGKGRNSISSTKEM